MRGTGLGLSDGGSALPWIKQDSGSCFHGQNLSAAEGQC